MEIYSTHPATLRPPPSALLTSFEQLSAYRQNMKGVVTSQQSQAQYVFVGVAMYRPYIYIHRMCNHILLLFPPRKLRINMRCKQLLSLLCLVPTALCALWNVNIYIPYRKLGRNGHVNRLTYSSQFKISEDNAQAILGNVDMWSGGRFKAVRIRDRNAIQISTSELADNSDDAARKVGEVKGIIGRNIGAYV